MFGLIEAIVGGHVRFDSINIDALFSEKVQKLMSCQNRVDFFTLLRLLLCGFISVLKQSKIRPDSFKFLVIAWHHTDDFKLAKVNLFAIKQTKLYKKNQTT